MTERSILPIHAFDIAVYGVSASILLVVSICAMSLPALRATQIDPMQALRNEQIVASRSDQAQFGPCSSKLTSVCPAVF